MKEREFTSEELAGFDGREGRSAYVAVDGVVYDATASPMWRGGNHARAHDAGIDLSEAIGMAPHPKERLERLPRVGILAAAPAAAPPETAPDAEPVPALAALASRLHAHPASIHYPIALLSVAAVLNLIGRIGGWEGLVTAGLINLVLGLAAAPMAILSGFLDWRYYYGGSLSGLFAWKFGLSFLLLALGAIALGLKMGEGGILYDGVLLLLVPVVMGLGFVGGRVVFPVTAKKG